MNVSKKRWSSCDSLAMDRKPVVRVEEAPPAQETYHETSIKPSMMFWLNFMLRFTSVRLHKKSDVDGTFRIMLKPALGISAGPYPNNKRSPLKRLLGLAIFSFATYISIKYTVLAALQFERDRIFYTWKPLIRENGTRTQQCTIASDIIEQERDASFHRRLDSLNSWLELAAHPLSDLNGFGTLVLVGLSVVVVCFFHMPLLFVAIFDVSVDHIGFMHDPAGERLRVKNELLAVASNVATLPDRPPSSQRSSKVGEEFDFSTEYQLSKNWSHYCDGGVIVSFLEKNKRYSEELYTQTLIKNAIQTHVRPANLSSEWHRVLVNQSLLAVTVLGVAGIIYSIAFMGLMLAFELHARTSHRLDTVRCEIWMPGGIVIKDSIRLAPLSSVEERKAYLAHDNSSIGFIQLALLVEFRHYMTPAIFLSLTEMTGVFFFSAVWVSMSFCLYGQMFADKLVWLRQICTQLNLCTEALSEHKRLTDEKALDKKDSLHLSKLMTTAYFNYEVFRRRQKNYQLLSNFIISQHFTLCAVILTAIYSLKTTNVAIEYRKSLLLTATYLMLFMNGFMLSGAVRTHQIEALVKSIMKLLVAGAINSMQRSHKINIWKRQMFSIKEARQFFAPSLMGLTLSYDKLLTVNAYLFAVWLTIFR